jgi:solute carrier family 25 phosphate transporter 23/24/25/41
MTGTLITHPLDTIRLRMALPKAFCAQGYSGMVSAFSTVSAREGVGALYKGLGPTMAGRGLHSFPFQLNLSSSAHRTTQLNS